MNPIPRYPVGIQSFPEIIEQGYLYVDKTALMHRLVNESKYIFLSRPRRFGKSLLLSTMQAYFEGRRELFAGLAADSLEHDWKRHPVLRLDLSAESYSSPERLEAALNRYLTGWEKLYGRDTEADTTPAGRFSGVIRRACALTGRRVVVLIDEYDKPMLENIHDDPVHESMRRELRGFYSVLKEADEHIRFAMVTGVSKFGHVSIFSGLNNLRDISLLRAYNDICGISDTEFDRYLSAPAARFAADNGMTPAEARRLFADNYAGYLFCDRGETLYNPFSVLSAMQDGMVRPYWFETGTPGFLVGIISRYNFSVGELAGSQRTASQLADILDYRRDLVPMLYQSGYLTIGGYDAATRRYTLRFPNREVEEGFWEALGRYYIFPAPGTHRFDLDNFVTDVAEGRPDDFMRRLQSLFADTGSENERRKEVHFQNVVAIVFKLLGYRVRTECHMARGRADMVVGTPRYVYIFEFKIDSTPQTALDQIRERGYAEPYAADPRRTWLIGANFSTRLRTLDAWLVE